MLKINNNFKKYRMLLIAATTLIGSIFLFRYLTFIPEYSSAESISTTAPITLPEIEGEITNKFGTAEQGYKTYMQEIDLKYCQSLPVGTTGQLVDGRDGKIYWVTVLGDKGKNTNTCWMTQDLDLDLGPNGSDLTTTNDGDNLYKGSAISWDGGKGVPSSQSGWTTSDYTTVNWWERDNGTHKAEHNFLGNLYSYEAATAGTGSKVTSGGDEVPGSICPAGWKLPLGSGSTATGTFNGLGLASSNVTKDPYYFQMGGYINSYLVRVGRAGGYWSATSRSNNHAYDLNFDSNVVFPANNYHRYYGFSVRCVVRDPSYTAPTMPTPSESDINNPNVSVTVNPILTLEVSDKEVEITPKTDEVMTGDFTATVSANQPYTISLSSAEGYDTALTSESASKINAITSSQTVEAGKNGWGIRVCNDTSHTNCDSYKGITPYGTNTLFYTSSTGAINKPTLFNIGIGINSDLPSGTYSTNILVTTSQK